MKKTDIPVVGNSASGDGSRTDCIKIKKMMISNSTFFRVTYSDTDQMGFMHHSNYLRYYESARWELFRELGIPYSELEKENIILPVVSVSLNYLKPALYDRKIKIITRLVSFHGPRLVFEYQMLNENHEVINEARVVVGCVRKSTGKACFPPESLNNALTKCMHMDESR